MIGAVAHRVVARSGRVVAAVLAAAAVAATAGCASFSPDGGFDAVERVARERLDPAVAADVRWARTDDARREMDTRTDELLAGVLDADAAVRVALLNNRGLQAAFHELGIVEADLVAAGRLPNPGIGFGRFSRGDEREIERSLHLPIGRLIAMPLLQRLEQRRFARAQGVAAANVLALAGSTRKAWVDAVAAEETVRYAQQVMQAAEAGAELARRMAEVGNFSALRQAREQSFHADAALALARARLSRDAARERLTRLLGLWGDRAAVRLPARLPDLPREPRERPDVERLAIAQRLDVQGARIAVEQTAGNLGLTRATRFVDAIELGLVRNGSNQEPTETGWEIGFRIPLFDWGTSRVAKAESVYRQAAERAAETAINARSEVRQAYGAYRAAWEIARHQRDEVVPLKSRIAEENLLRYNAMLIGVFELLADARSQIAGVTASIDALRDFWIAEADLEMALVGRPELAAVAAGGAPVGGDAAGAGH